MALNNDAVSVLFHLLLLLPCIAAQTNVPAPPPSPVFNIGTVFNPNMAIIMIVLVCAFFALAFISVYIRQCSESRIRGGAASDTALFFGENRWSRRAGRGVGDEIIRTLPTFRYSTVKGLKIGEGALECAVCLNEFEDHETLRLLPKCSHVFHADCVDAWLSSHNTCPVCRANLLPTPGENMGSTTVQIFDHSAEPNPEPVFRSPELSPGASNNQYRPPRTRSTGLRFGILLPRSHSTGHSPVQPGENCERFTLTLPEDLRSRIMNLNRTRSLGMLPRARSERKGYRSVQGFDRPGRWGFGLVPSIISRPSFVQSMGSAGGGEEAIVDRNLQRSLLQSFRNPVDRLFLGLDKIDRSSDRLRLNYQV